MRHLNTIALSVAAVLLAGTTFVHAQLPPAPTGGTGDERRPRLFVPEPVRDLGEVIEGDHVSVQWRLENRGNADLIIEKTKTSCGCTVVDIPDADKIIPPNGVLEVKADFDSSHRKGTVTKTVSVYSNDPLRPIATLEFNAQVSAVYNVNSSSVVNLRKLRRGWTAKPTIDITPAEGRGELEVLSIHLPSDSPLSFTSEALDSPAGPGRRIRFTANDNAPFGTVATQLTVKLRVGDIEKTRKFRIRGMVVGDVVYQPTILNETRHHSRRGKRLAPVMIQSTTFEPFDIVSVAVGPPLTAEYEQSRKTKERTLYTVFLTIRDDAPIGPFGTTLEVRTSLFNQPLIRVPVFAIVSGEVEVDPALVLLRQDGTPAGMTRRVKLAASVGETLEISEATCSNSAVVVAVAEHQTGTGRDHERYLDVSLGGKLPAGRHEATVTVTTNIAGAERLEIPVSIVVPASGS